MLSIVNFPGDTILESFGYKFYFRNLIFICYILHISRMKHNLIGKNLNKLIFIIKIK